MSSVGGSGSGPAAAVEAALLLTSAAATAVQGVSLPQAGDGGRNEAEMAGAVSDMSHVLTALQQSEGGSAGGDALSSVIHTQPHVLGGELGVVASAHMSADPESLRFQYPMEEPPAAKRRSAPTVYREQDRFLPINNVSRVMRNAIPRSGKVSKDAKECMQECVSEFISFITSEAADRCSQEKRKTLTGDDILFAMATLGFDNYIEPMKLYLQKIREYTKVEKVPTSRERMSQQLTTPTLDMQTLQPSLPVSSQYPSMAYGSAT